MAHSGATREIGKVVDRFLLKWKLSDDDYFIFLEHACDAYRDVRVRHSNAVVTAKVSVSALGIIEMPSDMIGFGNLYVPIEGQWWSFTDIPRKVTTTTTTLGVEGQDSDMGEGVDINKRVYYGVGGVGGYNEYGRRIDWEARRIFCDGFKSDTAVLVYTSSGLEVGASTFVPTIVEPVIDRYLLWKYSEINNEPQSKIQYNQKIYDDEVLKLRIFNWMPTKDELTDIWDRASTMTVQR